MVFLMESGEGSPRGALAARGRGGPDEDEDDTWEPMGATLGSRLHLGELDMLHKAGRPGPAMCTVPLRSHVTLHVIHIVYRRSPHRPPHVEPSLIELSATLTPCDVQSH